MDDDAGWCLLRCSLGFLPSDRDGGIGILAIVCYRNRFIFIANPKAASTSVEFALRDYQDRPDLNDLAQVGYYTKRHIPAPALRARIADWESFYSFAIIRHPYEWVASQIAYNAARLGRELPTDRRLEATDIDWYYDALRDRRGQQASPTATQWAFLCDDQQQLIVSRLIKMDTLSSEWQVVLRELRIQAPPLPRLNTVAHPPARNWLSKQAKARTLEVWTRDYDLYLSS
jgi:hypothetical protein